MTDYIKTTDFAAKDTLPSGDSDKVIRGTEFDTEFNAIATASATKADTADPNFTGNVDVTGNITVSGTVDGRDVSVDGTKLDTVETNADVTDTANVTAAGAVMDSELTDEAAVKALDQGVATTDSPTFAGLTVNNVIYTGTDGTDGQVLTTDGAGNATFEALPDSLYLNVKDFGATGDGSDQTTALQNAINHASTRGIQTIFFPDGHYKYTTLRFYHDQTDNTAFQGTNLFIGDSTNGTDGTATFAFGWYIADASDLTVTVEGTEQVLDTDYTVSGVGSDTGGTVTFTAGNVPQVPSTSTILRDGDGSTLEFFYSGEVVPGATNLSVTVGGVTSTDYTVDIGKRLVVFNSGFAPPSGTNNVVITIEKTVKISSTNRDGRFQLRGTGRLAIADLVGLDKNRDRIYGAVLETTGDGIIIDTDQEFSTPADARNWVAKDLTFIGDNTGYLIKAEKSVGMSLDTCSFKQFNPNGGGIQPRNCWFFTMNQCYLVGQRYIETFTAVADGITLEQFTYTFDNPSATSDILVQFNGGALTETTDYTVTMGATKTVTLTATGATKIGAEYTLSGNRTINVQRINTGSGVSSQFVGRSFGNFAGLWTISQSLVDSFSNGVHWTGGTVTNFSIRDSAIQNCGNYNIYADEGVIQQMLLDNVYFENQKTQSVNFIKGNGALSPTNFAVIRNLRMTNCFMLGGGTNPRVTGPCIDLDNVDAVNIEGMYVFRVRQPFLNVSNTKNFTNVPGEIKNSIFATDSGQTKYLDLEPTVYLLNGELPNVHNCIWPGFDDGFYNTTNNILLFDSTVESNFLRQYTDIKGTTGTAKFGFGDTKVITVPEGTNTFAPVTPEDEFTYTFDSPDSAARIEVERKLSGGDFEETSDFTVNLETKLVTLGTVTAADEEVRISTGSPYNITGSDSRSYYDLTHSIAGGLKAILPDTGEVNDGRLIIIKNNEASTSGSQFPYINVVNNSDQSTTIGRLSPGQAGLFIVDKQDSTKFKYVGRTFTDNLELTDNHKITFGRGTPAGPDMEVYHDNASGESRIDTLAGLTLDGLTYPTADGTSGQSIITDGSGNLTFGTAAGTGITAVVEDTMPQLGGDLESNGNNILFADNDKAIFGAGSDLQIYHSGTNSFIQETGTGNLILQADEFLVQNTAGTANYIRCQSSDESVQIRYAGSTKLATTSIGIDVTGSVTADGLTVDGQVSQSGAAPSYTIVQTDTTDLNTRFQVNGQSLLFSTINDALNTTTPRFNINNSSGDISFYDSAGTSQDLYWDASASRLGLGETNPVHELHIKAATPQIRVEDSDGTSTYGDMQFNATTLNFISRGGTSSYGAISFTRTNGTTSLITAQINAAGDFRLFNDTGTERLRWDASTSRLGINNDSPDARLDVTSETVSDVAIKITNNQAESGGSQNYNINMITKYADEQFTLYNTDTYRNMSWIGFDNFGKEITFGTGAAGSGTQRMVIDSSGNVGIGDDTPVDRLTVSRLGATWTGVAPNANTTALFHPGTTNATSGSALTIAANASSSSIIYFSSDTDNDIGQVRYDHSDNSMRFRVNNSERMVIDSNGNLAVAGQIEATASDPRLTLTDSDINCDGVIRYQDGDLVVASDFTNSDPGSQLILQVDSDQSFRMDGLNRVAIGNVTYNGNGGLTIDSGFSGALTSRMSFNRAAATSTLSRVLRFRDNGVDRGFIEYNTTATTYSTSSDERLKENIVDAPSSGSDIDAIQVRSFDWIEAKEHQKYGMIAQELIHVAPSAVSGDPNSEEMMGVDYSKLVPMLIKEVQDLRARVEELEGAN